MPNFRFAEQERVDLPQDVAKALAKDSRESAVGAKTSQPKLPRL
jgi:hypothetical protein